MKVRGLTRRDLLRWGALGGAGIAAGGAAVTACGDNVEHRPPGADHAAAILEPEPDSFIVSVWGLLARAAAVEVRSAATDDTVYEAFTLLDAYTAAFDVSGLEPDTEYVVTIDTDDGTRMVHRARTAPRPDDRRPVRLAISADIDPYPEFISDIIGHVVAAKPELFISLGDFPYTDNIPAAHTEAVYRERHAQARTDPRVRHLLEAVAMRSIYDDHEFRNDWDAAFVEAEPARYAAAMKVYDQFFPQRGGRSEIKYQRFRWGAHVECFLLDCRRFRSANLMPDGPDKTMLGLPQRTWLVDGVRSSTATFKLVLTSVPLDYGDGFDHWASFARERNTIMEALAGVSGLLFVSADQHWFADHRHAYGMREFQVGPLARGVGIPINEGGPGVLYRNSRLNAGILDVDGESLSFSGLGVGGEIFYKQRLTVADLTPTPLLRR